MIYISINFHITLVYKNAFFFWSNIANRCFFLHIWVCLIQIYKQLCCITSSFLGIFSIDIMIKYLSDVCNFWPLGKNFGIISYFFLETNWRLNWNKDIRHINWAYVLATVHCPWYYEDEGCGEFCFGGVELEVFFSHWMLVENSWEKMSKTTAKFTFFYHLDGTVTLVYCILLEISFVRSLVLRIEQWILSILDNYSLFLADYCL